MTEFRKASGAVELLEKLISELLPAATGAASTASVVSADACTRYNDAQAQISELSTVMEKMRLKCRARADLEVAKEQLRAVLPGAPEEPLKVAQELIDSGGEGIDVIKPLFDHASDLDAKSTYGGKMVEKVMELLLRFDASRARFASEIAPRLGDVVAGQGAEVAARQTEIARQAEAAASEAARIAEEEARRPVEELKAQNQRKLQAQQEAEEAEARRAAEELELERQAKVALEMEEESIRRMVEENEKRLLEIGPDAACGEALVAMLAMPVGTYREVVEALQGMIGGIASEPADVKRRVMRTGNEAFHKKLGCRVGVWFFLRGVGFSPRMRDELPAGLGAAIGLGPCQGSERFLYLVEPDMMADFEAWQPWHERIKQIASLLEQLGNLVFQRTAAHGKHGFDIVTQSVLEGSEVMCRWEGRGR